MDMVIVFGVSIVITVVVVGLIIRVSLQQQGKFQEGWTVLGAQKVDLNSWAIPCEGLTVLCEYHPQHKNSPARVVFSITGSFWSNIVVRREVDFDKMAKNSGINKEAQINDLGIDEQFYFECEDEAFVRSFCGYSQVKAILKDVLRFFDSVEIVGNKCSFKKSPVDMVTLPSEEIHRVARKLTELIRFIPQSSRESGSLTPETDSFNVQKGFFIGGAVAFFIAGIAGIVLGLSAFSPVASGKVFLSSLWVSLPVLGILLSFVFQALKGHATSAQTLLVVAFFGVIGVVLSVWMGMVIANGMGDVSRPVRHQVQVINKHVSHSRKHGDNYYILVSPWNDGQGPYQFKVSYGEYDRIGLNAPCVVTTRAGRLGFEWVVGHSCAASTGRR